MGADTAVDKDAATFKPDIRQYSKKEHGVSCERTIQGLPDSMTNLAVVRQGLHADTAAPWQLTNDAKVLRIRRPTRLTT